MAPPPRTLIERVDRAIATAEAAIVVAVMVVMIALSSLQVFLHKVFDTGFDWADIVVRQMVLWLGFVGGALATYKGRHIAIDAVGKFLSPRTAATARVVTSLAAALLTTIMLVASFTFVRDEIHKGAVLFGNFPAWPFKVVMPVAFAAITFHFLVGAFKSALVVAGKRPPPSEHTGLEGAVEDLQRDEGASP